MLTVPLLAAAVLLHAPAGSRVASVNDPLSHGTLGDTLLSLDEAIRVANGTLAVGLLSAAEQARITGAGTSIERIVIDSMVTPTITLQAPLTAVTAGGMLTGRLTITGMSMMMPGMPRPALQGGGHAHILALRSHFVTVEGLRLVGGQVGVDAQMMPMGMAMPDMAMVMDCELQAQTTAGVRLHGMGMDESMLMVVQSTLRNMPVGVLMDDQSAGGSLMFEGEYVTMDNVQLGCDVLDGGSGPMSMCMLFRSSFQNGAQLARKRTTAAAQHTLMFRFVHCDVRCTGDVLDLQGGPSGITMVHHHHSDFVAGAGRKAFWVWPRTSDFDIHGSEMTFEGDVVVTGNPFTMRVWQQNNTFKNGTITYDVDGALPNLLWNRYENCSLVVPATARSPVAIRGSEFVNSQIDGQSAFAPVSLQGCHRTATTIAGQVTDNAPAPARFLGTTTVTPVDPQIGTSVRVSANVPFGIGLVWDFAISYARPVTTAEPVRFYGDPATVIVLPGMVVFQSHIDVPLPNNSALVGMELYAQGISLPLFGQSYAPVYHLPRGGLIRPRL